MTPYDFVIEKIKEAGEILLTEQEKGFKRIKKSKDLRDITTSADLKVNDFLNKEIKKSFPNHGIYSEEEGIIKEADKFKWVIDPIDGSANFSRGIPHFAICFGLLKSGEPFTGAVYNPLTKELFSFKKGQGAFLNNKPICVSKISNLSQAHVFFHAGRKKELQEWGGRSYQKLLGKACKTNNFACSSLDICFVACGRIEANIYGTLSTLDIAPAIGILIEAGGLAVGNKGVPLDFSSEPKKIFTANNKKILKSILEII